MAAYETQGFKLDNSGKRVVVDPVMSILLPLEHSTTHLLGVDVNGKTAEFTAHTLGAQRYAWLEVGEGENVFEASYG